MYIIDNIYIYIANLLTSLLAMIPFNAGADRLPAHRPGAARRRTRPELRRPRRIHRACVRACIYIYIYIDLSTYLIIYI